MNKIYNCIGLLLIAVLLPFVTSCVDDTFRTEDDGLLTDEVKVNFNIGTESYASSRAGESEGDALTFISDGLKCDMLIYAVYRVMDDGCNDYLESYGTGIDPRLEGVVNECGPGQSVVKVDKFPYTFFLNMKRGYKYKIAFWAQNSTTKAFNTNDLRKVEMIYSEVKEGVNPDDEDSNGSEGASEEDKKYTTSTPNNDDKRDAFCRTIEIDLTVPTASNIQKDVYLYRPLTQINIGANGFDYEIVNRMRPEKYVYSKIRIDRVARYLNVVADSVYHSTINDDPYGGRTDEAFSVVDYGWAKIPAYYDMEIPDYPTHTIFDWKHNPNYRVETDGAPITSPELYEKEEFLRVIRNNHADIIKDGEAVYDKNNNIEYYKYNNKKYTHLDSDGKYFAYANYNDHNNFESETYKYLSMCYVFTASTKDESILFNNIKVWLSTDGTDATAFQILDLDNVPAQRNHRTNIVGNLLSVQKNFEITMDTNFGGDMAGWSNDNKWNEYTGPLAEGVFYDAEADEIQISSREGLIWFQRMVNGDLTIRDTYNDSHVGEYYYYNPNGSGDRQLIYKGISRPDDEMLRKRIMRATHQDRNPNSNSTGIKDGKADAYGWPMGNRFHFIGYGENNVEERAKVKLMADIDLSGVEWIPIGFEGKIMDQLHHMAYGSFTSFGYGDEKKAFSAKNSNPYIRGFWGEFDGNNHTISNLTTKRFGVKIMDWDQERVQAHTAKDGRKFASTYRYTDNVQWLARGLFGEIFSNAKIRNVRLVNPDIKGCNGVGGIVGVAFGDGIEITNCIVDGGSLVATPLYRGDKVNGSFERHDRTFARGVYLGGIVGCFNTKGGKIEHCQVNNMVLRGYRRIGGLVGSVDLAENRDANANVSGYSSNDKEKNESSPASISYNSVNNTIIIGSSFSIFDYIRAEYTNKRELSGFGFAPPTYRLFAQKFIGGDIVDYNDKATGVCKSNSEGNLTFAEMRIIYYIDTDTVDDPSWVYTRRATIQTTPLQYMPLLSSWYADHIEMNASYHGHGVAKKIQKLHEFAHLSESAPNNKYKYPVFLPYDVDITWDDNQPDNIGVYVESVELIGDKEFDVNDSSDNDGENDEGPIKSARGTVITPDNVTSSGSATMFITARDHKEYWKRLNGTSGNLWYKKTTLVKDFVLRGEPYAYTGILLSPNENMKTINLENIAIYDVYRTLALDGSYKADSGSNWYWPNTKPSGAGVTINALTCNFRGYTVPGPGWEQINYTNTTFGNGSYIKEIYDTGRPSEAYTCLVESKTVFKNCYFKAPYIVKKSGAGTWSFESFNGKPCYATGATTANVPLTNQNVPSDCVAIYIDVDFQGNPIVTFYKTFYDVGSRRNVECE